MKRFSTLRSLPTMSGSIRSIALLRGAAVLLVLWDHVAAQWPERRDRSWIPVRTVQDWVSGPLGIIQNFGFLGVCIFFLVSGYIISEVAVRETRAQFAVKRFLRIYPPLIASILIILALDQLRPHIGLPQEHFGAKQAFWAMTLLNYVRVAETPVNGVAWSLIIEVLFYCLVFAFLPVLKRRAVAALGLTLAVVVVIVLSARDFPVDSLKANWLVFAVSISYIPLLLMGQAIWMWRTNRVSGRVATALVAICWVVFVLGLRRLNPSFLSPSNSYGVSITLALAIFVAALLNESRLRVPKPIAVVSVLSYSIYLVHGPVTGIVMDRLFLVPVALTISIALALVVLAVFVLCLWRLVELPSQGAAKRLSRMVVRQR